MTTHTSYLASIARLIAIAATSVTLAACRADAVLVLRLLDSAERIEYRVLDDGDCSEAFGGNDARRLTRGEFKPRGSAAEIPFGTPLALPVGGSVQGDVVRVELTVAKDGNNLAWCGCPTLPVSGGEMEMPVVPEYGTPMCRRVVDTALPGLGDNCTGACDAGICVCSNDTCSVRECMAAGDACATCEYVDDGRCVAATAGGHGHQCTDESFFCTDEQACVAFASFDYRLAIETQPGAAFLRAPFGLQPAVRLEDEDGILVELSAPVSLQVAVGSGSLLGETTAVAVDGIAQFVDIGYDTVEEGVVLRAESGDASIELTPVDVRIPPGACQQEDALFRTSAGGCQDQQSQLVWSSVQPAINWHRAVWDAARGGPPRDAWDLGRTNDYDESAELPCGDTCDNDVAAGCHSLAEGGQRDWRLPSALELITVAEHLQMGVGGYLANEGTGPVVHSSTSSTTIGRLIAVSLATALSEVLAKSSSLPFLCVRGGRSPPTQLVVLETPRAVGVNTLPLTPLSVALRDQHGATINAEGDAIVLSADPGTVAGAPSAPTDIAGVATLDSWHFATQGLVTLTISIPAMPEIESTTVEVVVGAFPHSCAVEDDRFTTAEGGCHHAITGLAWGSPSPAISWHDAIWDSENPVGNTPPDVHDGGRTHDYDNLPSTAGTDASTRNHCHELTEAGFEDWRVPTRDELVSVYGDGALTHFGFPPIGDMWSSTTTSAMFASAVNLQTGVTSPRAKPQYHPVICVRDAP